MATQNIAAVPNKTYIQIHFRNVQSLCNIDNGNLSVKRTILANPTMDIPDHTYSLIRILDDRVITEPEEHEDKEIHSEEDIVYHDKYPFNKYEMEKELYSECMDVLHKLEFTITLPSIPQTFQSLRAGVGFCGLTGTLRARRETYSLSFWTFAVLNTAGIGRICAC